MRELLQQALDERDALRRTLESIAVGEAQAAEELIALGYWRDIPEARPPAAPAPVVREPLTRAQIAKVLADTGLKPEDYREDGLIEPLVWAIERAHGIGGGK